ncbi:hypothetical protein ZWY2020_009994 [Hordeum vulgare]|nr:hypothetical protein ZWY2020_009994 [Hordeum vulgare]
MDRDCFNLVIQKFMFDDIQTTQKTKQLIAKHYLEMKFWIRCSGGGGGGCSGGGGGGGGGGVGVVGCFGGVGGGGVGLISVFVKSR